MDITLSRPDYSFAVLAPTSKSAVHRALICAAFADKPTSMRISGAGEDIAATLSCLSALGAKIDETTDAMGETALLVTPISELPREAVLDCGESGSTLRFLVPIAAVLGIKTAFLRHGRLPQRPMSPLSELLTANGVTLSDREDGALVLSGKLAPGHYKIAANVSSQFITGLLFALSLCDQPSTLTLLGEIESAPYIDMTIGALAAFGAAPERSSSRRSFHIVGRTQKPLCSPGRLLPEGDFSGAAFPLAAGAIGHHAVCVTGLDLSSSQGDRAILELLERFGAEVKCDPANGAATVSPAPLHGIQIDARQIPDLVPILAVIAATAEGETVISGAARLRIKERDRIATTAALLTALGGDVTATHDGLIIHGRALSGGTVNGAGDHRIVMSAAIASLVATGPVTVTGIEAVAKSYPRFFDEVIPSRG